MMTKELKPRSRIQRRTRGRKRYQLPDLRSTTYTLVEPGCSDDEIREIHRKHHFPDETDLRALIRNAWFWWQPAWKAAPDPPASVRRRYLAETAARAQALEEALTHAGAVERSALRAAVGSHNLDLEELGRSVHSLCRAAKIAGKQIPRSKPGRRGHRADTNLLEMLYRVFCNAFGQDAARVSKSDKYGGRFFEFADDVFRLFGAGKSNAALGKAIERMLKALDRVREVSPQ